jgi:hypothetical protein
VIYPFTVGRLNCAVVSDGQMTPPWEPPLAAFFSPAAGVPENELHAALLAEDRRNTTLSCGYNCLLVQTSNGHAVIDTGLGARFLGYGPPIEPLVGKLGDGLALNRAADDRLLVQAYHMPFPGLGTITRQGDAYRWQPIRHDGAEHLPVPTAAPSPPASRQTRPGR